MGLLKEQNSKKRKSYDLWLIAFFFVLFVFSLKALLNQASTFQSSEQGSSIASISKTFNEVRFRKSADFRWQSADKGQNLKIKDRLYTGKNSQADIIVQNNKIRIKENSLIEIGAQKDFDIRFEFGHLVLNMSKSPLKIIIQDKKYTIEPKKEGEIAIEVIDHEVKFFADEEAFKITNEESVKPIEVVKKDYLNIDLCGKKTNSSSLGISSLCPECTEEFTLTHSSDKRTKHIIGRKENLRLDRGPNLFFLDPSNEICEIFLLPLAKPETQVELSSLRLDHESGSAVISIAIDSLESKNEQLVEISLEETFRKSRKWKLTNGLLKVTEDRVGDFYIRSFNCDEIDCS
jgi:hypothetical protein